MMSVVKDEDSCEEIAASRTYNHINTRNNESEPDDIDDDSDDDDDDASDRINIMDGLSAEALAALLEFQLGGDKDDDDDDDDNMTTNQTASQILGNNAATKFDKDTLCATYRPEDASRIAETLRRLHDRDHQHNANNNHHQTKDSQTLNTDTNDDHDDATTKTATITTTTTSEIKIIPMSETTVPISSNDTVVVNQGDTDYYYIRYLVETLQTDGVIRINNVLSSDLCHECSNYINQTLLLLEQDNTTVAASDTTPNNRTIENNNNTIMFGNVFARDYRYDMYLHPFREHMIMNILSVLLHPNHSILGQIFQIQLQNQLLEETNSSIGIKEEEENKMAHCGNVGGICTNDTGSNGMGTCTTTSTSSDNNRRSSSTFIDAEFHELSSLISDPGSISQPLHPDSPYYPVHAPLWTVFIALQNVTSQMGGTVVIPKTHTKEFHQLLSNNSSGRHHNIKSVLLQSDKYQYTRADLNIGDCIVMDSRTFLYGGANHISSNTRRTLLYFTIRNPYHQSRGYPDCNSLYPDLEGTLKLSQFK